ncbi:major facilitator superfamily domain-containing protein [Sphaerosporella brunnea]|uniref:Major facilitator superfamily domain-containing protein n=1 Tax=Sphaerosporella brunnea TaxID=1250544 RepID=A0A5J5EZC7_9PEZI|nr:major facilitator superfamily domain-containing protein [Sphaerosporella brunnea]
MATALADASRNASSPIKLVSDSDGNQKHVPPSKQTEGVITTVSLGDGAQQAAETCDPWDPINWPNRKKIMCLLSLCYMSFMTDFLAGYGVPMMVPQSKEWGISLVDATRSLSGNTATQGFGGLFVVPFAQRFGIMPVMFWTSTATFFLTIGCAVVPGWIGFIVLRILQGFFSAAGQVLGLTLIQEMYRFEEHARVVGFWGWAVLVGPYFGPCLSAFILRSLTWRQSWLLVSGFIGLGLLSVILLMDETAYDRHFEENNPRRPPGFIRYRVFTLSGARGYQMRGTKSIARGFLDIWKVFKQPHFFLLWLAHGVQYMWSVGINGTLISFVAPPTSKGGYGFSTTMLGLIYFAPITAIFNDYLQNKSIRRNRGGFKPEHRLWGMYVSTPFMTLGIILLGWTLKLHWHWFVVAFTWGLFVFAAMTSTVVISAYVLDCFPDETAQTAALLNFSRVLFGFVVPIFQRNWSDAIGVQWSFTAQGFICLVALGFVVVVQKKGKMWRQKSQMGPMVIWAKEVHHGLI